MSDLKALEMCMHLYDVTIVKCMRFYAVMFLKIILELYDLKVIKYAFH